MEQIAALRADINMIDKRLTVHEAECIGLRKEIREFMGDVKTTHRWVVTGMVTGSFSLLVWIFKQILTAHFH